MNDSLKNILWLVSYPKSGNTWFRAFLYALQTSSNDIDLNELPGIDYGNRRWFDQYSGLDSSNLSRKEINTFRPKLIQWYAERQDDELYVKVHDAYEMNSSGISLFGCKSTRKAIYLVRNPLDVAVSYAWHNGHENMDKAVSWICSDQHGLYMRDDMLSHLPQKLGSWSDHVRSWLDQTEVPLEIIRYEDMKEQGLPVFVRAVQAMGINKNLDSIKSAVHSASFEKLSATESSYGFREKSVRTKSFFRKGIVGSWRNELSDEQVDVIINKHGEMMERLGYFDENGSVKS